MALAGSGTALGDSIASALTDANAPPEMVAQIKEMWEIIGNIIVNHIVTNGQIITQPGTGSGSGVVAIPPLTGNIQ